MTFFANLSIETVCIKVKTFCVLKTAPLRVIEYLKCDNASMIRIKRFSMLHDSQLVLIKTELKRNLNDFLCDFYQAIIGRVRFGSCALTNERRNAADSLRPR